MDPFAVFLSRIQFGVAAGFHFIFPPLTFGLTLMILLLELDYYRKRTEFSKNISDFLIKILALVFVVGVASGIVLEFAFGTNWAEYSKMVGDIFGAPLAAEGIFSFFLESVFIAILIFGRKKVSPGVFLLSVFLVFFASHLSGLWILIANSWMQTPAGYEIINGRAILVDFWEAAINHSTVIRFFHVVVAGWITGVFLTAGIGAYYLLKNINQEYGKRLMGTSIIIIFLSSVILLGLGHAHSVQVALTQPEKMAAFEALWETQDNAPLALFGYPDEEAKKTYFEISIPGFLSWLIHFDTDVPVTGLNEFAEEDLPPVALVYIAYHIMIILGMFFIAFSGLGILLLFLKKLYTSRWFLFLILLSIPLPLIANEFGWIAAEVGRQPWAVYHILRTSEAASVSVSAGEVLFSLITFSLIYALLLVVFIGFLIKIIKTGPEGKVLAKQS